MNILVTGHRGRIGSHIESQLTAQGHTVVGFDKAGEVVEIVEDRSGPMRVAEVNKATKPIA